MSNNLNATKDLFLKLIDDLLASGVAIGSEKQGGYGGFNGSEEGAYTPVYDIIHSCPPAVILRRDPRIGVLTNSFIEKLKQDQRAEFFRTSADPRNEILVIAHESGHRKSHELGTRTAEYELALSKFNTNGAKVLNPAEKKLIYDEEVAAWTHGREILRASMMFDDWAAFDRKEQDALAIYREILGL